MVDISELIWFINQLITGGAPPCINIYSPDQKSAELHTMGSKAGCRTTSLRSCVRRAQEMFFNVSQRGIYGWKNDGK